MVKQQVVGFVTHSNCPRRTHPCPSPAPLLIPASEHPGVRGGCWGSAKGAGAGNACPAFDGLSQSLANFSQRLPSSSSYFCMQQTGPQRRFLH